MDCPWQKFEPVISHIGNGYITGVLSHVLVQPFAFVTVTEYVPPEVTVIHCEVAPVLHKYEVAVAEHNCDDCPLQKLDPVIEH